MIKTIINKSIYSIEQLGRAIWKHSQSTHERVVWPAPPFQKGEMTSIQETDGGIMVTFTTGAIYYVNPSGEFYHLRTHQPPEEGATLWGVNPPLLYWRSKEGKRLTVNTDDISDYHLKL